MKRFAGSIVVLLAFVSLHAWAGPITVIGFNTESGADTTAAKVASQVKSIAKGVDIFGFSEVENSAAAALYAKTAAAANGVPEFEVRVSVTGGADRLAIAWNPAKIELVRGAWEFEKDIKQACADNGAATTRFRAPFAIEARDKASGQVFLFMVNHLQRGNDGLRHCQAAWLNAFATRYTRPIITVGDFNFDYDLDRASNQPTGKHDAGFDNLTKNGVFRWLEPAQKISTQCDDKYYSILDFVFVAHRAQAWGGSSQILFMQPEYCRLDTQGYSDHRPVKATLHAR